MDQILHENIIIYAHDLYVCSAYKKGAHTILLWYQNDVAQVNSTHTYARTFVYSLAGSVAAMPNRSFVTDEIVCWQLFEHVYKFFIMYNNKKWICIYVRYTLFHFLSMQKKSKTKRKMVTRKSVCHLIVKMIFSLFQCFETHSNEKVLSLAANEWIKCH